MKNQNKRDTYWFADPDPKVLVQQFEVGNYGEAWASSPMYQTFYRNMYIYYSNIIKPSDWDSGLVYTGVKGELIEMMIPMAKSLVRQLVSIQTRQKLAFRCLAESSESDVMDATRLGNALNRQIVEDQAMQIKYAFALEQHYLTGLGFLYAIWRTDKGQPFQPDEETGVMNYEGDLEITAPTIWDLEFDARIPDPLDWNWVKVRSIANRWDLIAQHPEMEEAILEIPSVSDGRGRFMQSSGGSGQPGDEDTVHIYRAYHKNTPSLPKGRMTTFLDENTILYDGVNVYGELPLYPCRGDAIPHCSYGDPFFSMLVPAQEMLDVVMSSNATNISQFGVQAVSVARGSNITSGQILGMNLLTYTPQDIPSGGRPEPLQLTQSAAESFKFESTLKAYLMDLSLVNSALRGNPPEGVTSGTAIATLQASALESINAAAASAKHMLSRCMMGAINCYQRLASVEHNVKMEQGSGQSYQKTFTGKDLDPIKRVYLTEVNPLMQTLAGRVDVAEKLMAQGLVKDIKAYFRVLEGAPPEEMYKAELSEEDLINRENEALMAGQPVLPINTDDHAAHMMQHATILNDPKVRMQNVVTQATLEHIMQHYELAQEADPFFTALIRTGKMPEGGPNMGVMAPPPGMPGQDGGVSEVAGDTKKKPAAPAPAAQDQVTRDQGAA